MALSNLSESLLDQVFKLIESINGSLEQVENAKSGTLNPTIQLT